MKFGSLIKTYRIKKGITQRELADGICSTPHLSKIENNTKEVTQETLELLLKKLNINLSEMNKKKEQAKELIVELQMAIVYYHKKKADSLFISLTNLEDQIMYTSYINKYFLTLFRYFIFKGDLKSAEKQNRIIMRNYKNFNKEEDAIYKYFKAIFLTEQHQYNKADEILTELLPLNIHFNNVGEFYYYISLIKSLKEEPNASIHYGRKALTELSEDFNFIGVIHTLINLGINYTHTGFYEEAFNCYKHLLRNIEILNSQVYLLPQIFNNIAYLLNITEGKEQAIKYYRKSLEIQNETGAYYIPTLYNYAKTLSQLNKKESYTLFKKVKKMSRKFGRKKYLHLAEYHLLLLKNEAEAYEFIEDVLLPFFEKGNLSRLEAVELYSILEENYKNKKMYDKALKFIDKKKEFSKGLN
jgi:HTH-type transcriptional regulator, quorum sensing regulator NprR